MEERNEQAQQEFDKSLAKLEKTREAEKLAEEELEVVAGGEPVG